MALMYLVTFLVGAFSAALGLLASCKCRRTVPAMLSAYWYLFVSFLCVACCLELVTSYLPGWSGISISTLALVLSSLLIPALLILLFISIDLLDFQRRMMLLPDVLVPTSEDDV